MNLKQETTKKGNKRIKAYEFKNNAIKSCQFNFGMIGSNKQSVLFYIDQKNSLMIRRRFKIYLDFVRSYDTVFDKSSFQEFEKVEKTHNPYGKIIKINSGYHHYILRTESGKIIRYGRDKYLEYGFRKEKRNYKYGFSIIKFFQNQSLQVTKVYGSYYMSYFLCSNSDLYYCGNVDFLHNTREVNNYLSETNPIQNKNENNDDFKSEIILCTQDVKQCWVNQFSPNLFFQKNGSDQEKEVEALYAMGNDVHFQLAIGSKTPNKIRSYPVRVPKINSNEIVDLAFGATFSTILIKKKSNLKNWVYVAGFNKKSASKFQKIKELTNKNIKTIHASRNLALARSYNNDLWLWDNKSLQEIPNSNLRSTKNFKLMLRKIEFDHFPPHFDYKISSGAQNNFFFHLQNCKDKDLRNDLFALLKSGILTDLTIPKGIKVHKLFMEIRLKCKSDIIIKNLEKYKASTIRNFIKYVYTGKIFDQKYFSIIRRIVKKFKLTDLSLKTLKRDLVTMYYDVDSIDFNIITTQEIPESDQQQTEKNSKNKPNQKKRKGKKNNKNNNKKNNKNKNNNNNNNNNGKKSELNKSKEEKTKKTEIVDKIGDVKNIPIKKQEINNNINNRENGKKNQNHNNNNNLLFVFNGEDIIIDEPLNNKNKKNTNKVLFTLKETGGEKYEIILTSDNELKKININDQNNNNSTLNTNKESISNQDTQQNNKVEKMIGKDQKYKNKNKDLNDNSKKNEIGKENNKQKNFSKIQVHKFILCARCALFRNFFELYGSELNEIKDYTGNSYPFFEVLIKFLYTNKIEVNDLLQYDDPQSILEELFDSINFYQLHKNTRPRECLIQIKNYLKSYFK
ncbi:hypothetical protein M0813_06236 [Anaeramoeba flamelloides]|uniref:BTB domain-containing protein n=1 Tax=Anaeramoeba flamelloides TaxID=1746091 RepID=A0ABQ8XFA1_9EUKA|nr:hypothetical protein M0813_06236 [Anaeramoeba flamelloides]